MFEALANILWWMMILPTLFVASATLAALILGAILANRWYGK